MLAGVAVHEPVDPHLDPGATRSVCKRLIQSLYTSVISIRIPEV